MDQCISTTALAKALQLPPPRLFTLLQDYDWITRNNEKWCLTSRGEQQGGSYRDSKKYGKYIVWPERLVDHPLLQAAADANFITASLIGEHFQRSGRYVNRVLREMGWLRRANAGWLVTEIGLQRGGVQQKNSDGVAYASWPKSIVSEPELQATFNRLNILQHRQEGHEPDLFEVEEITELQGHVAFTALDGHILASPAAAEVCQWLYVMGITHAHRRALPGHAEFVCDFYLPLHGLYIDIWSETESAHALAEQLAKKDWCQQNHLKLLELDQDAIADLDNVLNAQLKLDAPAY